MTTTVETDSDIWVHDYTTATGVQVAGHWRKRRPGPAVSDDAGQRAELDVLIVTDEAGILVSASTTELDLAMLAAVTPLVARGSARANVRRDGVEREYSVRSIKVLGETLFVGALGGNFGPRERELATSANATRRILLS